MRFYQNLTDLNKIGTKFLVILVHLCDHKNLIFSTINIWIYTYYENLESFALLDGWNC